MRISVDIGARIGSFAFAARFTSDALTTALFGRSGSGKTSLLNAIAGLIRPQRGRIAVGDTVFFDANGTDLPVRERRIGYVFQEGRLFPHLSVRSNLAYGRYFAPHAERYARFDRVVELLDLTQLLERRPRHLSGGERQRVAIGRALLASPRLLLMDEPLAALDSSHKTEILRYIERLRDEMGIPLIYVSHALDEVMRLADTLVLISAGEAVAAGPLRKLAADMSLRPYLGRFEGGAVIETRVAAQEPEMGLTRLDFPGGSFHAPDVVAPPGAQVRVRVRARDVSLALSPPVGASFLNVIAGRVVAIGEEPGATVDVQLDCGGTTLIARVTRKSVLALGLRQGTPVHALIKSVAIDRHSVGFA